MENLGLHLMDFVTDTPGNGCWYLSMRAADKFYDKRGKYPNEDKDFELLRQLADDVCTSLQLDPGDTQLPSDYLKELCRFGNSKIHTVGAVIGGVGAQEVIKLITKKWTPANNTFIFNGIHTSSTQLSL